MNLILTPDELEALKELVESSINKIALEVHQSHRIQNKVELLERKEELSQILSKIKSLENPQEPK